MFYFDSVFVCNYSESTPPTSSQKINHKHADCRSPLIQFGWKLKTGEEVGHMVFTDS